MKLSFVINVQKLTFKIKEWMGLKYLLQKMMFGIVKY